MLQNEWLIDLYGGRLSLRLVPRGQNRQAVQASADPSADKEDLVFLLSGQLDRPSVRQALLEIHRRLTGRRLLPNGASGSPFEMSGEDAERELREVLFDATERGVLRIERVEPPKVLIPLPEVVIPPELRPQEAVEEELSDFAVRFIDDAGESIGGLELNFSCRGKKETVTTDGDGVAEFRQYEGSFGQLTVKDPKKLAEILEPRFEKPRARVMVDGKFTDMILRDELSPLQLESFQMMVVIVRPEPGQIFLSLFDKTGQVSHNLIDYEITGPMSFSGTTSEVGQVQHADVIPGDYKLKFTLEYPDALKIDPRTFELPVVVLDASDSSPQVRLVGAVPYARMARIRGALFDTNKTFLLPTAIESLQNYRQILQNKGPSQLVLVGHTDTQGKEKDNQKLSVARADSVKQFLSGAVDDWLKNYEAGQGGSTQWGAREDRLMIVGICDAESRRRAAAARSAPPRATSERRSARGVRGEEEEFTSDDEGRGERAPAKNSEVRPDPRNFVLWYQTRHNELVRLGDKEGEELKEDGISGSKTRKQLVTDYMKLIGEPWTAHVDLPLDIFTTGLGEECPLDSTGLALDERAVSERDAEADPLDRRVEFFFFDKEFGAAPLKSAPSGDSPPSKDDYIVWRQHLLEEVDAVAAPINSQATLVPLTHAHFRTGSAVMLPEGETPTDGVVPDQTAAPAKPGSPAKQALTSVGALATALRFNEERPGHKVLVAGHTDSVGSDKDNDQLSEQRAKLVHAVLTGGKEGRSTFQDLANETGKVSDWKQILKWSSAAFPRVEALVSDEATEEEGADGASGDPNAASTGASDSDSEDPKPGEMGTGFSAADPGPIDDNASTGKAAVEAFQTAYNENHKLLGGSAEIAVDGEVGKETWGAIYDLYQYNMAQELGEDLEGLKKLQGLVEFLGTKQPYIGFGESAPVDGTHDDNTEEQADRRVEVLFFAQGQEPDIVLLDEDPKVSELYHPDAFRRVEIEGKGRSLTKQRVRLEFVDKDDEPVTDFDYDLVTDDGLTFSGTTKKGVLAHKLNTFSSSAKLTIDEIAYEVILGADESSETET